MGRPARHFYRQTAALLPMSGRSVLLVFPESAPWYRFLSPPEGFGWSYSKCTIGKRRRSIPDFVRGSIRSPSCPFLRSGAVGSRDKKYRRQNKKAAVFLSAVSDCARRLLRLPGLHGRCLLGAGAERIWNTVLTVCCLCWSGCAMYRREL